MLFSSIYISIPFLLKNDTTFDPLVINEVKNYRTRLGERSQFVTLYLFEQVAD
jgi:hypothetical protein